MTRTDRYELYKGNLFQVYIENALCASSRISFRNSRSENPSASIVLPATPETRYIKPRSKVKILFLDVSFDPPKYCVVFEGEVTMRSISRGIGFRNFIITASHITSLVREYSINTMSEMETLESNLTNDSALEITFNVQSKTIYQWFVPETLQNLSTTTYKFYLDTIASKSSMDLYDYIKLNLKLYITLAENSTISGSYPIRVSGDNGYKLSDRVYNPDEGMQIEWKGLFQRILSLTMAEIVPRVNGRMNWKEIIDQVTSMFIHEVIYLSSPKSYTSTIIPKVLTPFVPIPMCNVIYPIHYEAYEFTENWMTKATRQISIGYPPLFGGIRQLKDKFRAIAPPELENLWDKYRELKTQFGDVQSTLTELTKYTKKDLGANGKASLITEEEYMRGILPVYYDLPAFMTVALHLISDPSLFRLLALNEEETIEKISLNSTEKLPVTLENIPNTVENYDSAVKYIVIDQLLRHLEKSKGTFVQYVLSGYVATHVIICTMSSLGISKNKPHYIVRSTGIEVNCNRKYNVYEELPRTFRFPYSGIFKNDVSLDTFMYVPDGNNSLSTGLKNPPTPKKPHYPESVIIAIPDSQEHTSVLLDNVSKLACYILAFTSTSSNISSKIYTLDSGYFSTFQSLNEVKSKVLSEYLKIQGDILAMQNTLKTSDPAKLIQKNLKGTSRGTLTSVSLGGVNSTTANVPIAGDLGDFKNVFSTSSFSIGNAKKDDLIDVITFTLTDSAQLANKINPNILSKVSKFNKPDAKKLANQIVTKSKELQSALKAKQLNLNVEDIASSIMGSIGANVLNIGKDINSSLSSVTGFINNIISLVKQDPGKQVTKLTEKLKTDLGIQDTSFEVANTVLAKLQSGDMNIDNKAITDSVLAAGADFATTFTENLSEDRRKYYNSLQSIAKGTLGAPPKDVTLTDIDKTYEVADIFNNYISAVNTFYFYYNRHLNNTTRMVLAFNPYIVAGYPTVIVDNTVAEEKTHILGLVEEVETTQEVDNVYTTVMLSMMRFADDLELVYVGNSTNDTLKTKDSIISDSIINRDFTTGEVTDRQPVYQFMESLPFFQGEYSASKIDTTYKRLFGSTQRAATVGDIEDSGNINDLTTVFNIIKRDIQVLKVINAGDVQVTYDGYYLASPSDGITMDYNRLINDFPETIVTQGVSIDMEVQAKIVAHTKRCLKNSGIIGYRN